MFSKFIILTKIILIIVLSISNATAKEINSMENSNNIIEFHSWSSLLGHDFKYDSIKELPLQKNSIIVAQLSTHPVELEVFVVEDSRIIYISSVSKRKVTCQTNEDLGSLNLVSEARMLEIEDDLIEMHPFYTIVETNKNSKVATYSYKSFYNPTLRKEIDRIEGILFRTILNKCSNIKIKGVGDT